MMALRTTRVLHIAFLFCLWSQSSVAETRVYKIAQGFPFLPWDVGPLEGVNFDVIEAICEANAAMKCRIEARPFEDCFDTDVDGNPFVGPGLASFAVDGCMGWFITAERERLGVEFGHGFSSGPIPQLIASDVNTAFDTLGDQGSLDAMVGFITGFFNDEGCLSVQYSDFDATTFDADQEGRDVMVAALLEGVIGLVFWDSINTVPEDTHLVGEPGTCGPALSMPTYPPSSDSDDSDSDDSDSDDTRRKNKSDALRRDYNCGLALIRENGVLEQICTESPHPGGDPACLLDGPPPTLQCLADNP